MEKLDCKSLMIGDWVHIKSSTYGELNSQVFTIEGDDDWKDVWVKDKKCFGRINESEIEPIPLTDEIMAKNFSQYSESYEPNFSKEYLITDIGATITYDVVTRLIGLPVRNIAGDWEFYSITEIRNVHQLQHFLRMLNIEKEIII